MANLSSDLLLIPLEIEEAADILGATPSDVRRAVLRGELEARAAPRGLLRTRSSFFYFWDLLEYEIIRSRSGQLILRGLVTSLVDALADEVDLSPEDASGPATVDFREIVEYCATNCLGELDQLRLATDIERIWRSMATTLLALLSSPHSPSIPLISLS